MVTGQRISHFEVGELLGRGGMGVVYRAVDTKLDRKVALKFLPAQYSDDEHARERFVVEAKAASALDHPHICSIYEVGDAEDGAIFIAMALYDGENLQAKIDRGPLPVADAVHLAKQVASGLAVAHEAGIVHRDIKPANVMVTESGDAKILDFGLAKMQNVTLTRVGSTLGTVSYMSPEQLRGEGVDHRTDIWALGVLLYEMLSADRPFVGDYEQAILYAVANEPARPLTDVPAELQDIIDHCLEKDPDRRYQTADEVLTDLDAFDRPEEAAAPRRRRVRRPGKLRLKLSLAATFLLVAAMAIMIRTAVVPSDKRIAVLPFINVSQNPEHQPYVDGLVHAVSSKIGAMQRSEGSLWVVPSDEVFRKNIETADMAAKELQVNLVVTGSVLVGAEFLQLTLNLVNARTGRLLRSAQLEEPLSEVRRVQDGVVAKIADLIEVEINPQVEKKLVAGRTTEPGAFQFYTQGQGYLNRYEDLQNVETALGLFRRAISLDNRFALGYASLATAFWRKYAALKDPALADSAIAYSRSALAIDEDLAEVRVAMGRVYAETGAYEEAEREFLRAIEIEPESADAYLDLALTYQETNRPSEAEEYFLRAIRLKTNYWNYYNKLGRFYFSIDKYEEAAEQFAQVIELAPDNPWGYNNLGAAYHNLGQIENAQRLYRQATTIKPSAAEPTAFAYKNLANTFLGIDDYAEAARLYEHAVGIYPNNLWAWSELGDSRHLIGAQRAAREAWAEVLVRGHQELRVNPRDADVLSLLSLTHALMGNQDSSLVYVDSLLSSAARITAGQLSTIGQTHEVLGDRRQAITYVTRALDEGFSRLAVETTPSLDELRRDPTFVALTRD